MALSGSYGKDVGSHWRLQMEWSATQSVSDNTSKVTAKLYWIADKYGQVNSSASKEAGVQVDGSLSKKTASGLASLNNGQKKLIHSYTKTISHNSDGTKSFTLDGYFKPEVRLGSTYYGTIDLGQKSFTLNTIPRASSLSSTASWTAGNNLSVSISRASSSFTHTVKMYVDGTLVKTAYNVGASVTMSFNDTENEKVFSALNTSSSKSSKIEVLTYNGSTYIGTSSKTGTCTAPAASTLSLPSSVNIGSTLSGTISRKNSNFYHDIRLYFDTQVDGVGYYDILTASTNTTSFSLNTANIASYLYNQCPNANSWRGRIRVWTHYKNGSQVQDGRDYYVTFYVKNSNPTFSSSQFTYADTNSTTKALTGNDQYIIQNKSSLTAYLNSLATPKNAATIKRYDITVNGVTKSLTSTGSVSFGAVNASTNLTMKVKVIDSRGNATEASKTVSVIEYQSPVVTPSARRTNNYDNETTISVGGSISLLTIGSTNKNSVSTIQYRYKAATSSTWGSWTNFSNTMNGEKYTTSNVVLQLDNTKAFNFEFQIKDALSTVVVSRLVAAGRPIVFIDSNLKSIGFNDFPKNPEEFRVNGRMVFGANMWSNGAGSGETGGGAMFLNNSDITGVNGLWFNDPSNNGGEGLLFLKSGVTEASANNTDYDSLYVRDSVLYLNGGSGELGIGNNINMRNHDITNVNHITINDPGGNEGIEWLGGSGWKIVEAPNDLSNTGGPLQFAAGGSRQATISTVGNIYIAGGVFKGESGGYTHFASAGHARLASDKGAEFIVGSDGTGNRIWSNDIYNRTYSSSPNMYITGEGTLGRSTSARKYKLLEEKISEELPYNILKLDPKTWFDKSAVEQYAMALERSEDTSTADIPYLERIGGLIAEDVEDAGLSLFVHYSNPDEKGHREVEGLMYDRLWVLLIPLVKELYERIEILEDKLRRR
ncbi:DUF859 domain-containing protein [Bacillus spizizenii]|nr:DUF859 domain-containing protein [Bacillus spizizenii]MCY9124891.1 DUF859 domain-containing protein [Bacillus spizizenii]